MVVISLGSAVLCSLNGQPWNELHPQSLKLILSQPQTAIRSHLELFLTHTNFFWELSWVPQQAGVHAMYSQSHGSESESEGSESKKTNRNFEQERTGRDSSAALMPLKCPDYNCLQTFTSRNVAPKPQHSITYFSLPEVHSDKTCQ